MNLKERMDSLPASKTMKMIELFFNEYNEVCKLKSPPTLARYSEQDYVKLINRKLTDIELKVELKKMVKLTQFRVLTIFMKIANELKEMINLAGGKEND